MIFSVFIYFALLANTIFAAPVASDAAATDTSVSPGSADSVAAEGSLLTKINGLQIVKAFLVPDDQYPITVSNGTHSAVYLVTMASWQAYVEAVKLEPPLGKRDSESKLWRQLNAEFSL